MAKITGEFTIAIPRTKDLTPPSLVCKWEADFDGEPDYEKALLAYFTSHYESGLKSLMEAQAKGFATPLASMQKDIDTMAADLEKIYDLMTPAEVTKAFAAFKAKYRKSLEDQIAEYNTHLADAVEHLKQQQLLVYEKAFEGKAMEAAHNAVKRDLRNKKIRHITGVVLKGALILSVAAAAIAATVLTFGTAGVIFGTIGAVAAGLGGVSALGKFGKSIWDIRNLEQRSLGLLTDDIEAVNSQLGKAQGTVTGLSKRIGDVSGYYTERKAKTAELQAEMKKIDDGLAKLRAEVAKLKTGAPKLAKLYAQQNAKLAAAEKAHQAASEKWQASLKRDGEIKAVLDQARTVVGDLNKIPFQGAKTVLDGLKKFKPSGADDVFSAVDTLSSLTGAVSSVG